MSQLCTKHYAVVDDDDTVATRSVVVSGDASVQQTLLPNPTE